MAIIDGDDLPNTLDGTVGDDTITARGGDDTIYLSTGTDSVFGGDGRDAVYSISSVAPAGLISAGDVYDGGRGIDRITLDFRSETVGFVLDFSSMAGANAGTVYGANFHAFESVWVEGTEQADVMRFGAGSTSELRAYGRGGDDTILGSIYENDYLVGGPGNDLILGDDGRDTIYGDVDSTFFSGGDDRLYGGRGNDQIIDDYGNDFLDGGDGDDSLQGGQGNDVIVGGDDADSLFGGSGVNEMFGGVGDDNYYLETPSDTILEQAGEGIDTLNAGNASTYILPANFENLRAQSSGNYGLIGNGENNQIIGSFGRDTLLGMGGADTLIGGGGQANELLGGAGDDTYVVELAGDTIVELASEGVDLVVTFGTQFTLSAHVENLVFIGAGSFQGVGNAQDNTIVGGASDDNLSGLDGADILIGRGGSDTLTGGAGADSFRYEDLATTVDRIVDFTQGQDVFSLARPAFQLTAVVDLVQGSAPVATSANATLLYDTASGLVSFDSDGNAAGSAVGLATIGAGLTLSMSDFVFYDPV